MKKIIAILLTLVMVLSLAACGKNSNNNSGNNSSTEQNNSSKKDDKKPTSAGKKDDGDGEGWPADIIASMAASVNATVPELKTTNPSYEKLLDGTIYIYTTHIEKEDLTKWLEALAEQGFVRSLGLISNSAFKVVGSKRFSVSVMGAEESYIITVVSEELEAGRWPYYQLKTAFGENFGSAVFDASGLLAGLSKKYSWSYDPDTFTATCNEAETELEDYVRDLALSASDYYDETNGKYVKYMFFMAIDESKTAGKQMECYVTREENKLTVRFALADHVE